ncbi:DEAD/DEAH box helicase family protein [Flavitalea antarctica]
MKELPASVKVEYSWRKYQQRVLEELNDHLSDQHLHIVAPPGSGKTVLGLEVVVRLNKPTLILAPTLAIRNQWINRFCDLFLLTSGRPDWISKDIRKPGFLTVTTYQALHAACAEERSALVKTAGEITGGPDDDLHGGATEEELSWQKMDVDVDDEEVNEVQVEFTQHDTIARNMDIVAKTLKDQGVQVIVADEAHHLQNEWWATLTEIKDQLEPKIVALTATPPYDVSPNEWQRYIGFAGPVDAEISVPELMQEGDLCPHQDLVYFTMPSTNERDQLQRFRNDSERLFQELKVDQTMVGAIQKHPIWVLPMDQLDWIYSNLSYYSACLIFMKANGFEVPPGHLDVIGDKTPAIPLLDYHWMQMLLDFYLFKDRDHFKIHKEHQTKIEHKLKRAGVLEKRKIDFGENRRLSSMLTSSLSKLNAIGEIVDLEYAQLGKDLRMVVLCDFIRREFLSGTDDNEYILDKPGVIPVFEKLRRSRMANGSIGVLTGSLIILPASALASFRSVAEGYHVEEINAEPLAYDSGYIVIIPTGVLKEEMIHIVTKLFESGKINILVGTRSLLGEGWDAPTINSLVLASFVGSFVLSNQMRGRAIRTSGTDALKTANIWHLVCLDPTAADGGADMELLKRRFKAFVGVSLTNQPFVANGITRLNVSNLIQSDEGFAQVNNEMFYHAGQRSQLANRWKKALQSGVQLVEEIKIPFKEKRPYQQAKTFYLARTLGFLLMTLLLSYGEYFYMVTQTVGRVARGLRGHDQLTIVLSMVIGLAILLFGARTIKALGMFMKYRDIGKDIQHIGEALLHSLVHTGQIKTSLNVLRVEANTDRMGGVACHLEGGTNFERSIFINTLMEIVGPVGNPRYVIIRRNKLFGLIKREDYHSVPEVLARNKAFAEYFASEWQNRVGSCDLIFTRNLEGRKLLLKFRLKSLSAQFEEPVQQQSRWSD